MDSRYQPTDHESTIYQFWDSAGAFHPRSDFDDSTISKTLPSNPYPVGVATNKAFSIVLPPPNANDPLHVGHAMYTIEDILIRYHRMLGDNTLWLPGTDHAGIETQYVFEKKLQKDGKSRFQFDRDTLYQMIWEYVQTNSNTATEQLKRLGFSLDWSRFTFTLDPKVVDFVKQTFVQLYQDNLIYRGLQLVNYCPKCGTSYSELEVTYVERTDPLYYIKYGPFTLATVRPETKFGDTALAVHPKDERYQQWIGQEIEVEGLLGKFRIKVIADDYVDPEFGTGVVKITPAHDPNDFIVGQKHHLPMKQVIGVNGKMTDLAGKYAGMTVVAAREQVVKDLTEKGLMVKVDEQYMHNVGTCYRCGRPIEPLPLPQFFLKVKDPQHNLVDRVVQALDSQETIIHGPGRESTLRNWLGQLVDWNISRQIVWGIRIPVWYYVEKDGEDFSDQITVSFITPQGENMRGQLSQFLTPPPQSPKDQPITKLEERFDLPTIIRGLQQMSATADVPFVVNLDKEPPEPSLIPETDTFDTWFSSGQWPVVTLKANQPSDFDHFYPTTVLETAYDILPIWVMRMMMLGDYLTGQSPFAHVYLHGLIRDSKGFKMSKSKGNVVNPLEVADKYGADALRLALAIRSTPAQDKSVGEPDFIAARNVTNKVWNAARYVLMLKDLATEDKNIKKDQTNKNDRVFFGQLASVTEQVTQHLNAYRPGQAADEVVQQFHHWFCDVCIEQHKTQQLSTTALLEGLTTFLKLLHPFIPYVTETIWQELPTKITNQEPLLITATWPQHTSVKNMPKS